MNAKEEAFVEGARWLAHQNTMEPMTSEAQNAAKTRYGDVPLEAKVEAGTSPETGEAFIIRSLSPEEEKAYTAGWNAAARTLARPAPAAIPEGLRELVRQWQDHPPGATIRCTEAAVLLEQALAARPVEGEKK